MRQKNECVVINLRKEIKDLCDGRKQSEMKIIDANRRLDELLQENKGILKVKKIFREKRVSDFNDLQDLRSVTQARDFLDRRFEDEKKEKEQALDANLDLQDEIKNLKKESNSEKEKFEFMIQELQESLKNSQEKSKEERAESEAEYEKRLVRDSNIKFINLLLGICVSLK